MWWYLKIKNISSDTVTYTYGRETKEQSGEIIFDKITEQFSIIKLALNDTQRSAEKLLPHLYRVIVKENCPSERLVAIG